MPIIRRALLISNPGETGGENYCKGVYVDIRNYQRLLASAVGGAWEPNEVRHLDRPTVKDVREWLGIYSGYDYLFVMFTGHGWFSSTDKDRILTLKKGEEIASLELLQGTKKRTLVLDCCQKVHAESLRQTRAGRIMAMANEARERIPNREACKNLFLNQIAAAESGFVRMFSCQPGEYSYDNDETGAFYNSSLIGCADSWASSQAQDMWGGNASLSVVRVHEPATEATRTRSANVQNPSIEKARTGPYFPFAVFA